VIKAMRNNKLKNIETEARKKKKENNISEYKAINKTNETRDFF
jgi:hypothetical protein